MHCGCVCVYMGGLFACLLFSLLLLADRDSGTTITPVRMTEREQVRGAKLSHLFTAHSADTQTERATPNSHTTNRFVPPPLRTTKVRENTATVIINTTQPEQTEDARSTLWKWPLLSNPLGDDLPNNVKHRNLKLDLKQLNRTLHKKTLIMWPIWCLKSAVTGVCTCMWPVHKRVDGLLRAAYKDPAQVWSPGMSASIPSCTGLSCVIFVKERTKSWEANRHHEVILVSGCGDWWQRLELSYTMLSNPHLHWAEIQWIWKGGDGAFKPINALQADQGGVTH